MRKINYAVYFTIYLIKLDTLYINRGQLGQCSWYSNWSMGSMAEGPELESQQEQDFPLLHVVQTGSGAYPAFYLRGNKSSFPGGKVAEAWS
jgi:hypothetical protein